MKTSITNRIRFLLDECLPPVLRDSRPFMYPFFFVWFKGKHVRTAMEFKKLAPALTEHEFRDVYRVIENFGSSRESDTNPDAMQHVLQSIRGDATSLLDVGCGRGYFLRLLQQQEARPSLRELRLFGCDLLDRVELGRAAYVTGSIEVLPFADHSIDVVTCFHTLEHTRGFERAVAELRRVAKKQLIIIVPQQRYYYFTLDLHLQFFPSPEALEARLRSGAPVLQFGSDLVSMSDVER